MKTLHWFRNDLRLADNPALNEAARGSSLLCVYLMREPRPWCNVSGMGDQRRRFLLESLADLQDSLRQQGQRLLVLRDTPEQALPELVARFGIDRITVSATPGYYERRDVERLADRLDVPLSVFRGNTLFDASPGEKSTPLQYTPFRRMAEDSEAPPAAPAWALPPPPDGLVAENLPAPRARPDPAFVVRGGTAAGEERLQAWMFRERATATYRDTRNALQGLYFSSQLSPWLANGSLSVRHVARRLEEFERRYGAGDSTDWFYRELLWREFFHWRAYEDDSRLFRLSGLRGKRLLKTYDPRSFARWCAGDTDFPLVNALMHQLVATGWMSNRGRQIAASCLVNELNQDWRYGAAFFEKHLLDHDVASNYGNWQYIAGVGTDPRGGRHFDLERQARQFDPDGEFTRTWCGHSAPQPEFVTDAADWPIEPGDH
jgi:deoxyribodipyrimidine photo-lyase